MAKTRMSQERKNVLRNFAKGMLTAMIRKEHDLDALEADLRKIILSRLKEEFPQKEMRVLAKYQFAFPVEQDVKITVDHSREDITSIYVSDDKVLVPNDVMDYDYMLNLSGTLVTPLQYVRYEREFEARLKERMSDYKALISAARYVEDVLEAFPAAEVLRERLTGQSKALVELNDETKIRIWEDQAKMVELAAKEEKAA